MMVFFLFFFFFFEKIVDTLGQRAVVFGLAGKSHSCKCFDVFQNLLSVPLLSYFLYAL